MTVQKVYHVYCAGFSGIFASLSETQAFIDLLRTRGCIGQEITVSVGHGNLKAAVYGAGRPVRREILKAA